MISQASLDGLNERLAAPLPMQRFRPNLVIEGATPHAEDDWRRVRIGELELECVKPCLRCVLTTVDPARGELDPAASRCARSTPTGAAPAASPSAST